MVRSAESGRRPCPALGDQTRARTGRLPRSRLSARPSALPHRSRVKDSQGRPLWTAGPHCESGWSRQADPAKARPAPSMSTQRNYLPLRVHEL